MVDLDVLAEQALSESGADAIDVLVDALLERGLIEPYDRAMLVDDAPFHPLGYALCPHLMLRRDALDWATQRRGEGEPR